MKLQLTAEQRVVIEACRAGEDLVVEAAAGAGKTSTMRLAAQVMRGRGLYLAYNKSIKEEAQQKFPTHVECKTAHGLAFGPVGKHYMPRIKTARQPSWVQAKILGITHPVQLSDELSLKPASIARLAMSTVKNFCYTADPDIHHNHVELPDGLAPELHKSVRRLVLPYACRAWDDIQNMRGGQLKAEHDHYLKTFAMRRPQLGYDFIILDEAQDTNPLVAALVQEQRNTQVIAVGDRAQSIYAWRGARDAMRTWPADQRLYLSQSFRFGPAVAAEANRWLPHCATPLRITGFNEITSEVGPIDSQPDAILCRTNATAVAEVMTALNNGQHRPALVGGGDAIMRLAEACRDLKEGRGTTHPELFLFETWGQVQDYVDEDASAADLRVFVELIDEHGPEVIINALGNLATENTADVVISTAHKAKGREWNTVRIADDFRRPGRDKAGNLKPIPQSEAMLSYVAVTRAQHHLDRGGLHWIDEYQQQAHTHHGRGSETTRHRPEVTTTARKEERTDQVSARR